MSSNLARHRVSRSPPTMDVKVSSSPLSTHGVDHFATEAVIRHAAQDHAVRLYCWRQR
jgi:hypothetical protein